MSLSICVLGSGSGGNCTLVSLSSAAPRHLLIDAGIAPRTTAKRLALLGVEMEDLDAILLTHLDRDHFHLGWKQMAAKLGLTVHLHRRHRDAATGFGVPVDRLEPFADTLDLGDHTRAECVVLPHDQRGSIGYVLEHEGVRLGFATDLGRVTEGFYDCFRDLDGVALESNYDRNMLSASERPPFLKHRITGGLGHLCNEQSLEAVQRLAECAPLRHIVLLHLSRQCNDPRVVTSLYAREARHLLDRLTITNQYVPSPVLTLSRGAIVETKPRTGEQMALFGGAESLGSVELTTETQSAEHPEVHPEE